MKKDEILITEHILLNNKILMSSVLEEILRSQPCGFVTTSKGKKNIAAV